MLSFSFANSRGALRATLSGATVCVMLVLSACGYRPLHGTSSANPQARSHLAAIKVAKIDDRAGQQLHTALNQKLARTAGQMAPAYTLEIELSESIAELAVEKDAFATRANLKLSAKYRLVRLADGLSLNKGTVKTVASYNILSSDFATLRAQQNARDNAIQNLAADLYTRLSTYFQGPGLTPPPLQRVGAIPQ